MVFAFLGMVASFILFILFPSSIHFPENFIISFFLRDECDSTVLSICIIHSSTDGYLGCRHCLTIVNRGAMNTEHFLRYLLAILFLLLKALCSVPWMIFIRLFSLGI